MTDIYTWLELISTVLLLIIVVCSFGSDDVIPAMGIGTSGHVGVGLLIPIHKKSYRCRKHGIVNCSECLQEYNHRYDNWKCPKCGRINAGTVNDCKICGYWRNEELEKGRQEQTVEVKCEKCGDITFLSQKEINAKFSRFTFVYPYPASWKCDDCLEGNEDSED